jgi:hypothetical protein
MTWLALLLALLLLLLLAHLRWRPRASTAVWDTG